jgi:hypothetical protein
MLVLDGPVPFVEDVADLLVGVVRRHFRALLVFVYRRVTFGAGLGASRTGESASDRPCGQCRAWGALNRQETQGLALLLNVIGVLDPGAAHAPAVILGCGYLLPTAVPGT